MDWQIAIVALIVAGAGTFIARRLWRSTQGQADGACDKCAPGKGKPGA